LLEEEKKALALGEGEIIFYDISKIVNPVIFARLKTGSAGIY
jgi:hypothetical protein